MNLQKYVEQVNANQEIVSWINTTVAKHLKKNSENVGEIEHILDFLQSEAAPKRLRRMSYAQALEGSKKWVKAQKKKGRNIEEGDKDTEVVKRWKTGFRLVKLVSENSFKREGFMMSHCVASYYNRSDSAVYSLRDDKNLPHCTIEVVNADSKSGQVQQIKGKGNGSIHPKYIKYVLSTLKTVFKMPIRDSELNNLGYTLPPDGYLAFLRKCGTDVKTMRFNKKEYIYNG